MAVPSSPLEYRGKNALARPAPLDLAGVTCLAVRVRVALPVAGLGVGAAAAAHPW